MVNNKEFIKKEASAYIDASIATDQAINLNLNAVTLLSNNKEFLKKEIRAYIDVKCIVLTVGLKNFLKLFLMN